MAFLKQALDETDVKKLTVAGVKKAYLDLAKDYNKIINGEFCYCHKCNKFKATTNFYNDRSYLSGLYPICKECSLEEATDYDKKEKAYIDNREKTILVFQKMNLPFYDSLYKSCLSSVQNQVGEKNRSTAYQHMLTTIKSLPQYNKLTWKDSEFDDKEELTDGQEIKLNQKMLKNAKKRFGTSYTNEDLMFLENEYQDWITRYECNTKAQEEVFENLSLIKLLKKRALIKGDSTKDLDKQHQDWLDTGNLKPKQNMADALSDAQTFGTLIQKWEETKPIPECDPELADVDKIGLLIDVFFKGHTSKMIGLKNTFSHIYENYMKKYTVKKPEYNSEEDSEAIFEKVFGASIDE